EPCSPPFARPPCRARTCCIPHRQAPSFPWRQWTEPRSRSSTWRELTCAFLQVRRLRLRHLPTPHRLAQSAYRWLRVPCSERKIIRVDCGSPLLGREGRLLRLLLLRLRGLGLRTFQVVAKERLQFCIQRNSLRVGLGGNRLQREGRNAVARAAFLRLLVAR